MKLSRAMENTILHWGEMGSRWGVNRSIAQIHALLYLSTTPLTADEIAETLGIARSNVSTSLRELQSWDLVSMTHVLGDRRDHFEAKTDLWEVLLTIVDERKRREIDPTVSTLRKCVLDADDDEHAGRGQGTPQGHVAIRRDADHLVRADQPPAEDNPDQAHAHGRKGGEFREDLKKFA